jgi:multidrug efflux pump subunit AcrA (membrane-fusion protein)
VGVVPLAIAAGLALAAWRAPEAREWVCDLVLGHRDEGEHAEGDGHDHGSSAAKKGTAAVDEHGHAATENPAEDADGHGEHEGHDDEAGAADHVHDEASALTLSTQAKGNIGLSLVRVGLRSFERTISVPGIIVERPGWSTLEVTAPMSGVVARMYPLQGEAVKPGQPLFEIRLTHEELLQAQTDFLKTAEELDIVAQEITRLQQATADGAIAGKTLLERQYEQRKQQALLRVQRQALLLHGLSESQADAILKTRTLLQSLTVYAPTLQGATSSTPAPILQVQDLKVSQGKYVEVGAALCTLADHSELYIEGKAFEQDVKAITEASGKNWEVTAVFGPGEGESIRGLKVFSLDGKVDPQSRTLQFYVTLPNRLLREDKTPSGHRFAYWNFKPGQRGQLRFPVEHWKDRIVLPVQAVAQEGSEFFVFEANGDHFDRRSVRVEYRDQDWVVIANDGTLQPGKRVAGSAAHQMQLALKNKAGGGVDPHAGHNH